MRTTSSWRRGMTIFVSLCLLFLAASSASAATLFFIPEEQSVGAGEEFVINVKINSDSESINAAQAVVKFPQNLLRLISAEKIDSIFSFWVEEPRISNEEGTLHFIGGTPKGVSGGALQVLQLKFRALGSGNAELTFDDAVITASDGQGTNVLSAIQPAAIGIGVQTVRIPLYPETGEVEAPIEEPQPVVRASIVAKGLPQAPAMRIPLYPDPEQWYSHVGKITALWEVPDDVIKIATQLDRNPKSDPKDVATDLFTGKTFGILEEGEWYVHVQFRNNIGWGPITHYRIAIDTTAPVPFEIDIDNAVSDNPSPILTYETQDGLSGIGRTFFAIDAGTPTEASSTARIVLPPQKPGKHTVVVKVFDRAGNSIEDDILFEVVPLPTPTIDFITQTTSSDEQVFVSGSSLPSSFVDVALVDERKQIAFSGIVETDETGRWSVAIDDGLQRGRYIFSATARDERGAVSLPTEPLMVRIKPAPVIVVGPLEAGWFEISIVSVLLLIAGGSIGFAYYVSHQRTREAYGIIASRDIKKMGVLLEDQVKEMETRLKALRTRDGTKTEMKALTSRMHETIERMKKYVGKELEKM